MTNAPIPWVDAFLPRICGDDILPLDTRTVLDLGCGRGVAGAAIRATRPITRLVGLDLYGPYLNALRRSGAYDELICHDLMDTPLPFDDNEFDVVLLFQVIEHLPKASGIRLLAEAERIGQVIVTTPRNFITQGALDGNEHQRHLSGWNEHDFVPRGYDVLYGVKGGQKVKVTLATRGRYLSSGLRWLTRGTTDIIAVKKGGTR